MGEAMNIIEMMREKIALVKGLPDKMILGIAARKIYGTLIIPEKSLKKFSISSDCTYPAK